jgi:capsular polysaccharide biosynthesis protein
MAETTDSASPSAPAPAKLVPAAVALVLAISLLIGALAYVVGTALPSVYQSTGLIRVTVLSQQGINDQVVTASNDLASQVAQLAVSQPVVGMAAQSLGVGTGSLNGKITGSTLGAQNLVQVTATASSRGAAARRAAAATVALARYQQSLNGAAVNQYVAMVAGALGPLDRSIQTTSGRIAKDSALLRPADAVQLETLLATRSQVVGQVSRDAASNVPRLQVVSATSNPSTVYPKPALYALVAFLVALIVTGRLAFMVVSRRPRQ